MAMNALSTVAHRPDDPFKAKLALSHPEILRSLRGQLRYTANSSVPDCTSPNISQNGPSQSLVTFSPPTAVVRRTLVTQGMAAEIVRGMTLEHMDSRFKGTWHLLIAYERGSRRDGDTFVGGMPRSSIRDLARKLVFVPAGHEYRDSYDPRVKFTAIYFYLDAALLTDRAETERNSAALQPRLFFEDATLWNTILKMKTMMEDPAVTDSGYFEALGTVLAHEVVRLGSGAPAKQQHARGGLAAWQQRVATAYIDEHLTEQISLASLAGLVRLSPYYFCRAFKQTFGVPPHRYHTNRRIEFAKQLLLERNQSITNIGLTVGFGETSSFSAAFRKATGYTPTDFQRHAG